MLEATAVIRCVLVFVLLAATLAGQAAVGPSRVRYSRLANHWALHSRGLVSSWQMDDGTGQTVTDYAGGYHGQFGTTAGVESTDPEWVTQGVQISTADIVNIPHAAAHNITTAPLSLLGVALVNSTASQMDILYFHNSSPSFQGYALSWGNVPPTKFGFWNGATWTLSNTAVTVGAWQSLYSVLSGSTVQLYLNGALDSSGSAAAPTSWTGVRYIGRRFGTNTTTIGFVCVYAIDLSAAQVAHSQRVMRRVMARRGVTLP